MSTGKEYGPAPPREQLRSPEQDQLALPEGSVRCAACEQVVPASSAMHEEGLDYVRHFCGLDCQARWFKHAHDEVPAPAPDAGKTPAPPRKP